MIAGMARQIRIIELIFGPVSRAWKFERKAVGLGAAPWKIVPVTREMASGKSELTPPYAKPKSKPTIKRVLYGLMYPRSRRYGPEAARNVFQRDCFFLAGFAPLMNCGLPHDVAAANP